jgi:exosortase
VAAVERQPVRPTLDFAALRPQLLLIAATLLLAIPTFIRLGQQVWTKEVGAQGPIVLATGAWLVWRRWDAMRLAAQPGIAWLTMAGVLISLPIYIFGRAYDFMSLEALGLYGFLLTLLYDRFGLKAMLSNWFPLFYLGFLLPAPGWLLDEMTAPLKQLVTTLATAIVEPTSIPIMQQGVTMTVGPYQLLVEDACSGMNSLIGLISITMFYIYLLRDASWRYSAFLVGLIIPIAIAANVVRIVILINLTYFFGDAVGQGFLHVTSGLVLFALSLLFMFAIDNAASRMLATIRRRA